MSLRIPISCLHIIFLTTLGLRICFTSATVVVNPQDTTVNEGQPATLFCQFAVPPKSTTKCSWTKDNILIDIDQYLGVYEWIGDPMTGNCSLKIGATVNNRDDATWICQLPATSEQQDGDRSSPARLSIFVTPTAPLIYYEEMAMKANSNLSVSENQTVTLYCLSRYGNPAPSLTWTMDKNSLYPTTDKTASEEDKPKQYITNISLTKYYLKEDNGKLLSCNLDHPTLNNTIESANVRLDIHYDTTKVEVLSPNYVVVDAGSGYSFICRADGNPPPTYEWLYKRDEAQNWEIKSTTSQYDIESASELYVGEYMCLAGNKEAMKPSSVITFQIRNTTKNVVAIIGGVFGALLIITVIVLIIVVIKLRKKVKRKAAEAMASTSSSSETVNLANEPNACTYMIPIPVERAPFRPPEEFELFLKKETPYQDMDSHIYAEPIFPDEVDASKKCKEASNENETIQEDAKSC